MPRTIPTYRYCHTIYVGKALKAQMQNTKGINWSRVCQRAIKLALNDYQMHQARDKVRNAIKDQGERVSQYKASEITEAARQLVKEEMKCPTAK